MSQFQLGTPTGKTGCQVCNDEIIYYTMDDMLECGISGIGFAPTMCTDCKAEETQLVTELGDKRKRDCPDCGWGRYDDDDDYEGEIKPGYLPSGTRCPTCKGKGTLGSVTEVQIRKRLIKRVKAKRRNR